MEKETPLFSCRSLRMLIWPLMLEQLLTILVGTVDSVMVASVGEGALSAVSLVDTLNQMIFYTWFSLLISQKTIATSVLWMKWLHPRSI